MQLLLRSDAISDDHCESQNLINDSSIMEIEYGMSPLRVTWEMVMQFQGCKKMFCYGRCAVLATQRAKVNHFFKMTCVYNYGKGLTDYMVR